MAWDVGVVPCRIALLPGISASRRHVSSSVTARCACSCLQLNKLLAAPAAAAVRWRSPQQQQPAPAQQRGPGRGAALRVVCQAAPAGAPLHADYAAKAGDSAVLQRPLKSELLPEEIHNVFGYPRNLKDK